MNTKRRAFGIHGIYHDMKAEAAFIYTVATTPGASPENTFRLVEGRRRLIHELPQVEWKGQLLRTILCTGERGRGPHLVNVPEALLWQLIDPSRYRCPYHA